MISRYTEDRHPELSKQATDVLVARRIVLHEIARDEHNIGRPHRGTLRIGKRGLERG